MSCRLHTLLTGAACLAVCGLLALLSSQYLLFIFMLSGLAASYWMWSAENRERSIQEWLEKRSRYARPVGSRRRRVGSRANIYQFPFADMTEAVE